MVVSKPQEQGYSPLENPSFWQAPWEDAPPAPGVVTSAAGTRSLQAEPEANFAKERSSDLCSVCKALLMSTPLNVLLPLVPTALFVAPKYGWGDTVVFWLNFMAILPLAKLLGTATESLASKLGDTIGGLLNASFGNAVEMILSTLALREGLVSVVQGSLLGSILSNVLLVTALMLTVVYCAFLVFQLGTHKEAFAAAKRKEVPGEVVPELKEEEEEEEEIDMPAWVATLLLFCVTLVVAACSEGLVGSVEGLTEKSGIPQGFVGVILLPIVGNAAEHLTAVTVAMKDKMDLSLGVALGSSIQIALLVVPFTVLVGWFLDVPMDLDFGPSGAGILLSTVLIITRLTADGESNWLEGAMLVGAYMLIAMTYWALG